MPCGAATLSAGPLTIALNTVSVGGREPRPAGSHLARPAAVMWIR